MVSFFYLFRKSSISIGGKVLLGKGASISKGLEKNNLCSGTIAGPRHLPHFQIPCACLKHSFWYFLDLYQKLQKWCLRVCSVGAQVALLGFETRTPENRGADTQHP